MTDHSKLVERLRELEASEHELQQALAESCDERAEQQAEIARLREALEPSGDTKAAYHGEFAFELYRGVSDAGIDQHEKVYVPWDTVKQIMAAIRSRAALGSTNEGGVNVCPYDCGNHVACPVCGDDGREIAP